MSFLLPLFVSLCHKSDMDPRGRPRRRPGRRGRFAERLRAARHHLEATQERTAKAIGVSRVTLARWETGSHRPSGLARRYVELWIEAALAEGQEVLHGR